MTPSFLKSIIFNLIRDYRNRGDARAAVAEARWAKSPKRAIDCFDEGFNKALFYDVSLAYAVIIPK
jgi:hypothetical protein